MIERTVRPSSADRALMRRYIVSGMSKVVLMAHSISHRHLRCNMDLLIYAFSSAVVPFHSCMAVYEKFKDGTAKDISDGLPFEVPKAGHG